MKFTLAQLLKFSMPYTFEEEIDLKDDLCGFDGILDIKKCHIIGVINRISSESYKIDFTMDAQLILECPITLKEIPYDMNEKFSEVFTTLEDDETFKIDGQTLDTKEAIITNLLVLKPTNVYAPGAEFVDEEEDLYEEEQINEAFKSLKDLL